MNLFLLTSSITCVIYNHTVNKGNTIKLDKGYAKLGVFLKHTDIQYNNIFFFFKNQKYMHLYDSPSF